MMKAKIRFARKVKAKNIESAMAIIKSKYPFAKMITYKFREDYRYSQRKDFENRLMDVVFIDNVLAIRDEF